MARCPDKTTTRGYDASFHTTHWTEIFDARSPEEPQRREALEHLLRSYWKPVYCYLRCKGYDRETAEDLTQGFFHEVVLARGLIQKADRAKARFRTFLLTALSRYAVDARRIEKAKRRTPERGFVRMEAIDRLNISEPLHNATPIEAFEYAWASALLDQVIAEVARKYHERGGATHWAVFRERVLQPIMENAESPPLGRLCERYGIPKEAKAANMIFTVKRNFRSVLRRQVRQFVDSDAEVDNEIRHLMRVFSHGAAASWEGSGRSGRRANGRRGARRDAFK
jgi:DNA-directed RNA polymerase specialized sigma24 family protein